jgi:hypothetical protein
MKTCLPVQLQLRSACKCYWTIACSAAQGQTVQNPISRPQTPTYSSTAAITSISYLWLLSVYYPPSTFSGFEVSVSFNFSDTFYLTPSTDISVIRLTPPTAPHKTQKKKPRLPQAPDRDTNIEELNDRLALHLGLSTSGPCAFRRRVTSGLRSVTPRDRK